MLKLQLNREIITVILSILVQLPLAVFLGHYYDERSFIDTGYLVSAGLNPYQPHLMTIFSSNPYLDRDQSNNRLPATVAFAFRFDLSVILQYYTKPFCVQIPSCANTYQLQQNLFV